MHACMHVHTRTHARTHAHTHTHACMHVRTRTHTHARSTHIHTESYIRAMGLKKTFSKRKVFEEDLKEFTEVD